MNTLWGAPSISSLLASLSFHVLSSPSKLLWQQSFAEAQCLLPAGLLPVHCGLILLRNVQVSHYCSLYPLHPNVRHDILKSADLFETTAAGSLWFGFVKKMSRYLMISSKDLQRRVLSISS